jgi:hypothetical protein
MVTELRDLLHDAAESPHTEAVDTDLLLSQAKRRVSRRRRSGAAGVCVAVASVALAAAVLTRTVTSAPPEPADPPTVKSDLSRAPMAVQGEDYTVVASYDLRSLAESPGRLVEAGTPDGQLVYRDGPDASSKATEIGLLDPQTEETTPLPEEIATIGANRIITSKDMIAGASYGVPSAGLWYFNTTTGEWGSFDIADIVSDGISGIDPETAAVSRIQFGTEGDVNQLFLSIGMGDEQAARYRVISVSLGGSLDPVDHGDVSLWAMSTGTLAYLPAGAPDSDHVALRDLTSGNERTIDIPGGKGDCTVEQLWLRSDRVIARQECSLGADTAYSRLQVFGLTGEPITELQDRAFEVLFGARKQMLIKSQSPAGLFSFDVESGDVTRLTRGLAEFEDLAAGEGALWVFGSPIQRGEGMHMRIAEFP